MQQWFNDVGNWFRANLETLIAAGLIIIGFVAAAYAVRWLIEKGIERTRFAKKAAEAMADGKKPSGLGKSLGNAAFWIIILVGVVQALDRLGMDQIVAPLNNMFRTVFDYLPNILGAILIFAVFMIVANVVRQASRAVLVFADPLPERAGLASGPVNVSGVTSSVLFAVVAILGGIAALDVLDIAAISDPANAMLSDIVSAIPRILTALIIVAIFYFIGRFVSDLIERTLPAFGLDKAAQQLGLLKGADKGLTVSKIASVVTLFFVVLLGVIQALAVLDFAPLSQAMEIVMSIGSQIVFGGVIIFAGVFVAGLVEQALSSTGSGASDLTARIAKWVIIVLASILGISRMGLDPTGGEFILYASLFLLGGTALAGGLAFGIGGRDWAGRQLEKLDTLDLSTPDKPAARPAARTRKTTPKSETE